MKIKVDFKLLRTLLNEQGTLGDTRSKEIEKKILSIGDLPTFYEVVHLIKKLDDFYTAGWFQFCEHNKLYNIENKEFVDRLATAIKHLHTPVIEVCAGRGKLSYWLRRKGISIRATDNYSWNIPTVAHAEVEKLSIEDALGKYEPRTVIGSWLPMKEELGTFILEYPSVDYFVDISEGPGGASWMPDSSEKLDVLCTERGFEYEYELASSRYAICRTDYCMPELVQHSGVIIFRRRK